MKFITRQNLLRDHNGTWKCCVAYRLGYDASLRMRPSQPKTSLDTTLEVLLYC